MVLLLVHYITPKTYYPVLMTNFAKGKYAQFISDRSGMAFPYKEMVVEWNGAKSSYFRIRT